MKSPVLNRFKCILAAAAIFFVFAAAYAQDVTPSIQVSEHTDHGQVLTDAEGHSLYMFTRDEENASACYDACADVWPPLLVEGVIGFGAGVDLGLLGAIEREDGSMQVTYGGHPLYHYAEDTNPGDAAGQGANDLWFLVTPDGEAVSDGGAASTDEANGGAEDAEAEAGAPTVPMDELMNTGASVFGRICAECHGDEGDSPQVEHAVRLADSERYTGDAERMIRMVLHGGGYMPGFGNRLSDTEVAAVVTFVRNSWGNDYGAVTPEEVSEMR